jgi:hypothetical protein
MLVEKKRSPISGWVRDLATFAATVTVASWQGWEARELIWGLWISSLVIGYAFILISATSPWFTGIVPRQKKMPKQAQGIGAIGMNVFVTIAAFMFLGPRSGIPWLILLVSAGFGAAAIYLHKTSPEGEPSLIRLVATRFFTYTPYVAFTLGFFTVHFGGFHFVHGLFLNSFFPLVEGTPFGESIGGTFAFAMGIVGTAARSFWPFILISAWSRLGDMKKALEPGREQNMFLPYASVVKMHVLIFVFAGLSAAGMQSWALYPVLLLYFFPAGSMLRAIFGKKAETGIRAGAK